MHRRREEEKIGGGIAQWVERPTEKSGAVLTRVRVPDVARGFLPESASSVECLTVSVQPPRVHSQVSRSGLTSKISNTDSHAIVWTHENTAHTDRNG